MSNHGGRQLDGVLSSARALPAIAEAVAGRIPILADGGVRSGLDVVRMLALGANFVLIGRAWVYALAAEGGAGVAHVLKLIEAEMRVAMALTGVTTGIRDQPRRAGRRRRRLGDVPKHAAILLEQALDVSDAHRRGEQEALHRRAAVRAQLLSWRVSSTPSAVVSIPSALASSVIAWTIAVAPSRVSRFWMKLRSILILSNGKLCR